MSKILTDEEYKWYNRLLKMAKEMKCNYVCSWWLRIEYQHEKLTTPQINRILSKVVAKGLLTKETTKRYTYFILTDHENRRRKN